MKYDAMNMIKDPLRRQYIASVFNRVREVFGDKLVSFIIYGSVARGMDSRSSDVDVLLILDDDRSYSDRCMILSKIMREVYNTDIAKRLIEKGYNLFVEFYPLNKEEAAVFRPIYLDMVHDAIVLYDRDYFFKNIMNRVRNLLLKLGSRRIWLDKDQWLWILKPDIRFGERIEYELE